MTLLALLAIICFGFATYNLTCAFVDIPTKKTSRMMMLARKQQGIKAEKLLDVYTTKIAGLLAHYLKLDKLKRNKLQRALDIVGLELSPEVYTARAWVRAGAVGLCALLMAPLMPLAVPILIGLAVALWFSTYYSVFDFVKKRRKLIESEIPRFALTIGQNLENDRDVLKILTSYRRVAGKDFGAELDQTIADMKTGNYENALIHSRPASVAPCCLELSPEVYTARAWVRAGAVGLCALLMAPLMPLAVPILIGLAVALWFSTYYSVFDFVKKRRKLIESEIPRFALTIGQNLENDRDVLKILTSYRRVAGKDFGAELDQTIADMKTGNYENALIHFETRIGSPMLSDVIRGLIGVLRGDDQRMYFKMICFDMRQIEQNNLKKEAAKRPKKIQRYSMMMLICIMIIYLVVLCTEVLASLGAFFG